VPFWGSFQFLRIALALAGTGDLDAVSGTENAAAGRLVTGFSSLTWYCRPSSGTSFGKSAPGDFLISLSSVDFVAFVGDDQRSRFRKEFQAVGLHPRLDRR